MRKPTAVGSSFLYFASFFSRSTAFTIAISTMPKVKANFLRRRKALKSPGALGSRKSSSIQSSPSVEVLNARPAHAPSAQDQHRDQDDETQSASPLIAEAESVPRCHQDADLDDALTAVAPSCPTRCEKRQYSLKHGSETRPTCTEIMHHWW